MFALSIDPLASYIRRGKMYVNVRAPYSASLQRAATSTDSFTAHFPKIDSWDYLLVRSLAVSDLTTGSKAAGVGISEGNLAYYAETLVLTTAGVFYKMEGQLVVPRGYSIVVRFVSPNSADKYVVNVTGELISYDQSSER